MDNPNVAAIWRFLRYVGGAALAAAIVAAQAAVGGYTPEGVYWPILIVVVQAALGAAAKWLRDRQVIPAAVPL